ncbi:MAG: DUF1844 domain-containing protein [Planctomycetota bacterium]
MTHSDSDSKIIVDNDWKSRVEQERRQAEQGKGSSPPDASYPEPTFELLVTTFSMQAMAAMGLMGGPGGAAQPADLGMARHLIDLLGVIEEKTRGNLTADEAAMLEQMLHQLRMLYLDPEIRRQIAQPAAGRRSGSKIELP